MYIRFLIITRKLKDVIGQSGSNSTNPEVLTNCGRSLKPLMDMCKAFDAATGAEDDAGLSQKVNIGKLSSFRKVT